MTKVRIQWTVEVTETYETEMDFEDFALLVDGQREGLTPEDVKAGHVDKSDIDAEELAGSEDHEALKFSSVENRYIDSFKVTEA